MCVTKAKLAPDVPLLIPAGVTLSDLPFCSPTELMASAVMPFSTRGTTGQGVQEWEFLSLVICPNFLCLRLSLSYFIPKTGRLYV